MDQLTAEDPTRLGPYRLIARLGAGGMGLVYLGRSEGGRTVAVKVVQAEYAGNAEFRRRFAREVAAARRVGGSWTAAVLDADPEAAVPWVATQYIPGPDLHTVVAEDFGPLPEYSVHALANRLALALQAVHEAGLIHRDLKPSNVLVTVDGPRVIDFGIARAMDSLAGDSLHTRTGMLIGSPGFMSPEQVRGLELTPASDVFCLGAVLVYAATGRMLFGATDTGLNAHLFRVAEEEADLTGVPDSLVDLVRACLSKDPAGRPTPREVAEATATDRASEWLPGSVLAQLGRHAAQLLDFAPPAPPTPVPQAPSGQAVPAQHDPRAALARPVPPAPAYAPTAPAHGGPAAGFGPPAQGGFGPPSGQPAGPAAWAAATAPASHDPRTRRWWALAVAAFVQLLVAMEVAVFTGMVPVLHADLSMDSDALGLMFQVHVVALAGLLPLGGHLSDVLGRRRVLVIGLVGFILAGALGGTAADAGLLIAARVLQGVSGALLTPAALSLVAASFTDPKERRTAFGVYVALAGGGAAVGMLVSGAFLELLGSWRLAVYAGIPLAFAALVGTLALVREPSATAGAVRFDPLGVLVGGAGLAALVYGLGQAGSEGWTHAPAVPLVAAGLLLLACFLWWQGKAPAPLIAPYALGDGRRAGSLVALTLLGVGTFALTEVLGQGLHYVLGHPPMTAGLLALPWLVATVVAATQISARLATQGAPRLLVAGGAVLMAVGLVLLTWVGPGSAYVTHVLPALLLSGFGTGMALVPLYVAATEGIAPQHTGGVAAALAVAVEIGAAIGAVVFGTVLRGVEVHFTGVLRAYGTSFWWGAGAALLAALVGALTMTPRRPDGVR
ncbi:MDR family MFS transporter [Streptomyces sp. NPDC012769]|uniref:MDR family MFS transporter n=1 Tax=Streptomyces sp. NPDC012769 TaxID=3364848 RepID=UPI0036BF0677